MNPTTSNRFKLLSSPFFLIPLAILLLNDFVLKAAFPGFITGKLSDFAGLFAFAYFLAVLIPAHQKLIIGAVAGFFIYWKSPLSNGLLEAYNSLALPDLVRVVDYADLSALAVLPFVWLGLNRTLPTWNVNPAIPGVLALIGFTATSQADLYIAYFTNVSYYIPADSREEVIQELQALPLEITYYDSLEMQNWEVRNLNDSVWRIFFDVYEFDTAESVVEVPLFWVEYTEVFSDEDNGWNLTDAELEALQEIFERKVIDPISD